MKNFKLFALYFLITSICYTGCSDDLLDESNYEDNLKSNKKLADCTYPFGDYGNAQSMNNLSGVIIRKSNTRMLKFYDPFSRSERLLDPCNLPTNYRVGDKVRFSGFEKISPPHVRLAAPWLRLTQISKIKN